MFFFQEDSTMNFSKPTFIEIANSAKVLGEVNGDFCVSLGEVQRLAKLADANLLIAGNTVEMLREQNHQLKYPSFDMLNNTEPALETFEKALAAEVIDRDFLKALAGNICAALDRTVKRMQVLEQSIIAQHRTLEEAQSHSQQLIAAVGLSDGIPSTPDKQPSLL